MDTAIAIFNDLIMLVFNLALYVMLTPLKKDTKTVRGIMYGTICSLTLLYILCAYVLHVPFAVATILCMSLPSFLLFLILCKYKGSRFLVTFCFIDTVTFIIGALGKIAHIFGGTMSGIISCAVTLALAIGGYLLIRPYGSRYRDLLGQVDKGWAPMAVSGVFNYILLAGFCAYPGPLIQRLEYLPIFFFLCVTICAFYGVFIGLILQKAQLTRANELLQQQQHWHQLAYLDTLTGLANTASYDARTEELQKQEAPPLCHILLLDIDDFKQVNDTYGHPTGNKVLKGAAARLLDLFPAPDFEFFRVGGDEFAAITLGLDTSKVKQTVTRLNSLKLTKDPVCTCSCGFAPVDFSKEKAFEQALSQADKAMYAVKARKKDN